MTFIRNHLNALFTLITLFFTLNLHHSNPEVEVKGEEDYRAKPFLALLCYQDRLGAIERISVIPHRLDKIIIIAGYP